MVGGACMTGDRGDGGHAWQVVCVAGGVHGRRHAWQGACMVGGCMFGILRILLECILVNLKFLDDLNETD